MLLTPLIRKKIFIIQYSSAIILKLIALDQITKWWFKEFLQYKPGLSYKVTSFLDLMSVWNYGISFGLFRNYHQYSNIFFGVSNSLIVFYTYSLLLKCRTFASFLGYSFIIAGAIGNIIDRIFKGAVFDFLYLHYHGYGLFIFNLADSFITIGVLFVIYDHLYAKKSLEAVKRNQYDDLEIEAEKIRQQSDKKIGNIKG